VGDAAGQHQAREEPDAESSHVGLDGEAVVRPDGKHEEHRGRHEPEQRCHWNNENGGAFRHVLRRFLTRFFAGLAFLL
jgi:hypothetical protein